MAKSVIIYTGQVVAQKCALYPIATGKANTRVITLWKHCPVWLIMGHMPADRG